MAALAAMAALYLVTDRKRQEDRGTDRNGQNRQDQKETDRIRKKQTGTSKNRQE